jgi:S1-C subfamily serine protease
VSMYTVTPDIAHSLGLSSAMGALVSQVVEGSPADKAGIRTGDVITSVNGQPVKSNSELRNTIGLRRVGDKVEIGLVRDGKPLKVTAVIADTAAELTGGPRNIHKGLDGATLEDAPDASGALVRSVETGSAAGQAGLRTGDVIVGANRGHVGNVRELRERARSATVLVLEVRRGNSVLLIPLR